MVENSASYPHLSYRLPPKCEKTKEHHQKRTTRRTTMKLCRWNTLDMVMAITLVPLLWILLMTNVVVVNASSSSSSSAANVNHAQPPSSHTCQDTPPHASCSNNPHSNNIHNSHDNNHIPPQAMIPTTISQKKKDTTSSSLLKLTLQEKWQKSPNSWVLRFSLPLTHTYLWSQLHDSKEDNDNHCPNNDNEEEEEEKKRAADLLLSMPTCISVHYNSTTSQKVTKTTTASVLVKKSYSPISHPSTRGYFDLLVKSYPPPPPTNSSSSSSSSPSSSDGVGSYLCSLQPGQTMMATLKPQRLIHGSPHIVGRQWTHVGLIAGGTGIAPLFQLAKILLEEDEKTTTTTPKKKTSIHILSINRKQEDILLKEELDQLAQEYPDRVHVTYSLTDPTIGSTANHKGGDDHKEWTGWTGRGSIDMVRAALPPPHHHHPSVTTIPHEEGDPKSSSTTMIFVCGTDGFVETWGGPIGRAPPLANGKKGPKIQGPLVGLLKEAGYDESEVFKY